MNQNEKVAASESALVVASEKTPSSTTQNVVAAYQRIGVVVAAAEKTPSSMTQNDAAALPSLGQLAGNAVVEGEKPPSAMTPNEVEVEASNCPGLISESAAAVVAGGEQQNLAAESGEVGWAKLHWGAAAVTS